MDGSNEQPLRSLPVTPEGHALVCPRCGAPMECGRAYVGGTAVGVLAVGLSWQHLWFESASGSRQVVRSSTLSSNIVPAHSCPGCSAVFLEPSPPPADD